MEKLASLSVSFTSFEDERQVESRIRLLGFCCFKFEFRSFALVTSSTPIDPQAENRRRKIAALPGAREKV
jgi:hypothetical protein